MHNSKLSNLLLFLIIITVIALVGCASMTKYGKLEKTARQNYQIGKYDEAFFQSAQALKIQPTYEKAQLLIQDVFRLSVDQHESQIEQLKSSPAKFKWDDIVTHYEIMLRINQEVKTLPSLISKSTKQAITFNTKDYTAQIANAKLNAAETHYQEGDRLSKVNELDVQKQAAKEFKTADRYYPAYKDACTRYEICRKAGIKRMAIIPFENKSGKSEYGAVQEMITDDVISNVMNDASAMEFLEIISRDQLIQVMNEQKLGMTGILDDQTAAQIGKVLGVHELLTGNITQIIYTTPRTSSKTYEKEASVQVGEESYVDSKGKTKKRAVYGTVTANVTAYEKTAGASINGSYKIIDVATAKLKKSESFKGNSYFSCEWGKFYGDKRALDSSSEKLVSKAEGYPPAAEELVNDAAKDLSNSLANTLKSYAR